MTIAVVTGSAGGMGHAIVTALLNQGYHVVGIDIVPQSTPQPAFTAMQCDLTDRAAVARTFNEIIATLGGIDVLVNNAGSCIMVEFADTSADELHTQMAINFDSAFYCCQAVIPHMLTRPGTKKIINISSNGAYNFDVFDPAPYRASKAALDSLTKHLARRHATDRICVNSLAPAMTQTPLFDVVPPEMLAQALSAMPHGSAMQPSQIAAWVAFLASPAGDCCSGNVIILNQGRDVR